MVELWDVLGSEGCRGGGFVVLACVDFAGAFGVQNDSQDELDDVEAGDEGGDPVMGVLGTVLTCGERLNLTLLLLGWGSDTSSEFLRGCDWELGSSGGGGK